MTELVVFDLDGTLLDHSHRVSAFTRDTLSLMTSRGIAYTVATGRNLHSAQEIIHGHGFELPHVYINGVLIWDPRQSALSVGNFLTPAETNHIMAAAANADLTPFIHTVTGDHQHIIFHPPVRHPVEQKLLTVYLTRAGTPALPLAQMPHDAQITNINLIGEFRSIEQVEHNLFNEALLVCYSGPAMENKALKWMDIHHSNASKGTAVEQLRQQLGVSRIICFGDSDNDLSMFAIADEAYATANAKDEVKAASTGVIGHHDKDGVAHFLRERFNL
jgi:Cof subfamily protein (haloacid dehalogenase superfamily)